MSSTGKMVLVAMLVAAVTRAEPPGATHPAPAIPVGQYPPLAGKVVGVVGPMNDAKAEDSVAFVSERTSTRLFLLPSTKPTLIQTLLGAKGETRTFDHVELATTTRLRALGLHGEHALVEIEVNGGVGSRISADGTDVTFAATKLRLLTPGPELALDVNKAVHAATSRHSRRLTEERKEVAAALAAKEDTLSTRTDSYVTWLAAENQLLVLLVTEFKTALGSLGQGQRGIGGGTAYGPQRIGRLVSEFRLAKDGQPSGALLRKLIVDEITISPPPAGPRR